jgi:probable aminopeptidase NPEPL1
VLTLAQSKMSNAKRVRSDSAAEERLIDSFVESCTSKFCSNVAIHAEPSRPSSLGPFILLLGTRDMIRADPLGKLPELSAAIDSAREGSLYGVNVLGARYLIGVVPTAASRCNCPQRPDVVTSLVSSAASEAGSQDLSVVACTASYFCISVAVAKAFHSFSSRGGAASRAFNAKLPPVTLFFTSPPTAAISERLAVAIKYVQLCMRLVDAPTNLLDTVTFTEIARYYAATVEGISFDVIAGEELREKGYGGVYGVGKAAEYPPALVTLHYKPSSVPAEAGKEKIALVGKGIVYDTGGLALKTPVTGMCNMKTDMGGAGAVLCGFLAAASAKVDRELSVTLCLADNAVGPRSFRNDDILLLKSGLTIEINNTDAEGRLVLSDGVYHASCLQSFVPDVVMDMATLTGAQLIATGKKHAALYVNDEETERQVVQAGKATGDTCFPVVFCPEYHNPEFSSKVADYRNLMAQTNNAGISCAGQFVANSLAKEYKGKFVHVDLAGPSSDAAGGTGFGVALFLGYIGFL